MEGIFLIDSRCSFSYERLLGDVNHARTYSPRFQSQELYPYFLNLVIALATGADIELVDHDLSPFELTKLGFDDTVRMVDAVKPQFNSVEELVETIRHSGSGVTLFTSGTTGQPKQIVHTMETLCRNVRLSENHRGDIWGYAYNPTHMAGLQVFLQALMNFNPIVNVFGLPRTEVYHMLEEYGITHLSATPTFYRLLLNIKQTFPSVRRITFGGEKSDEQLIASVGAMFPQAVINNVYASTEAGTLFASRGEYFHISAAIRDRIRIDQGELLIHRSLLGTSSSFVMDEEYYHTADLVEWIDQAAGLFRFVGRKNELLNVGGFKVNPEEIEEAINRCPGVRNALVYGRQNSVIGTVLCADIVVENILSEQTIREYLERELQPYKIPRRIAFVDALDLTKTGKVKRK